MIIEVKDIRQFRTFYKEEVKKQSTRNNEHFVGVSHYSESKVEFGFFELFHGDKEGKAGAEGIKGYLTGLLDMAKDGQAIYEFMQNAIDAGSSKLGLFAGKNKATNQSYLLVINNGNFFSFKDIRSILNVGISTKTDRSNIGKYGIGFKLAHRLVGKQNGLVELIDKNYGPLLFSWKNNELNGVLLNENIEFKSVTQRFIVNNPQNKTDKPEYHCIDNAAWFFKILATVFPCGINDEIFDSHHNFQNNCLTEEEIDVFFSWIRSNKTYLSDGFTEGSAFFMRLGEGKINHLIDSNITDGIKFSLSVLNHLVYSNTAKLKELKLNDRLIEAIDLKFLKFIIGREDPDFKYVLGVDSQSYHDESGQLERIEILFGYVDYESSEGTFRNSPNFYLFFPLSEEKHDFRFIIHSNAFDKSASRTFLLKGAHNSYGINERLFEVFTNKFITRLEILLESGKANDRDEFLEIYANLLLSNESQNLERSWVNKPLFHPMLNWMRNNIPIYKCRDGSFEVCGNKNSVFILEIGFPLPINEIISDNLNIFYWSSNHKLSSAAHFKFDLKRINLFRILINLSSIEYINQWLDKDDNDTYVNKALYELNEILATKETYLNSNFQKSFEEIKWFKFTDNSRFSLSQLKEQDIYSKYLIKFEVFEDIQSILERIGFVFTDIRISEFENIQKYLLQIRQKLIPYASYEQIPEIINFRLKEGAKFLGVESKIALLKGVYKIDEKNRTKEERLNRASKLVLFRSKEGELASLNSLIYQAKFEWLRLFEIQDSEFTEDLREYLNKTNDQIYNNIIIPKWESIIKNNKDFSKIYSQIGSLYNPGLPTLTNKEYVIANGCPQFFDSSKVYYNSQLGKMREFDYTNLRHFFLKAYNLLIPDIEIIKHLNEHPFLTPSSDVPYYYRETTGYSYDEIKAYLHYCKVISYNIFENYSIIKDDGNFNIQLLKGERKNCVSNNLREIAVINEYLNEFVVLPNEFLDFKNLGVTADDELCDIIVSRLAENVEFNEYASDYLFSLNERKRIEFCKSCSKIVFDTEETKEANLKQIVFLKLLLSIQDSKLDSNNFLDKISIIVSGIEIPILTITKVPSRKLTFSNGVEFDTSMLLSKNEFYSLDDFFLKLIEWDFEVEQLGKLKRIFEFNPSIDVRDFLYEFIKALKDGIIRNAEQLFFIYQCHLDKNLACDVPHNLKIKAETGDYVEFGEDSLFVFTESEFQFFQKECKLAPDYLGFEKLINENYTVDFEKIRFISKPFFGEGKFISAPLIKLPDEKSNIEFIDWLYKEWMEKAFGKANLDFNWEEILSFDPKIIITTENSLGKEMLPTFINEWWNNEPLCVHSKRHFLKKLGVNTKSSEVHRLRNELFNLDFEDRENLIEKVNHKSPKLLASCIDFFIEKSGKNEHLFSEINFKTFEKIYDLLDKDILADSPLPIRNKDAFTFVKRDSNDWIINFETKSTFNKFNISEDDFISKFGWKQIFDLSRFSFLRQIENLFESINLSEKMLDKEVLDREGYELSNKFYYDWRDCYEYQIVSIDSEIPWFVSVNDEFKYKFTDGRIHKLDHAIYVDSSLDIKHAINLIKELNILPYEVIDDLQKRHTEYQQKINTLITEIENGNDEYFKSKWELLKREIENEEQKNEIKKSLNDNSQKYSVKWFRSYLELLKLSSEQIDSRTIEKEITFGKIELNKESQNLMTLRDPSRTITPTIEYCTDFQATIHYGIKKIESIKINGVTKKGQTLIVLINDISFLDKVAISQINRVDISFSGVIDLLDRLNKSFNQVLEKLGASDDESIMKYMPKNARFIFGPPGTGKTTWISDYISKRILDLKLKILILTPTNKAADVVCEKILEIAGIEEALLWLVRYGTTHNQAIFENDLMYDRNSFIFNQFSRLVFIATIHRFPYEEVVVTDTPFPQVKRICDLDWDMVIFDESSMIPVTYITFALLIQKHFNFKHVEFYIAGDPFQIPPVVVFDDTELDDNDLKEENIYSLIGLKTFDPLMQREIPFYGKNITNLDIQYRSLPMIGKLFDSYTYAEKLSHYRATNGVMVAKKTFGILELLISESVSLIKFPVNDHDTVYKPEKLKNSPYQLYSALLVSEIIKRLNADISNIDEIWTVGIICPYRAQASFINKIIESINMHPNLKVVTDTVHGFQGDECDLVFALFNPSQLRVSNDSRLFLNKQYLVNVAISRAKDYLVLIYPDENTFGYSNLKEILKLEKILADKMNINIKGISLESCKVEKLLFGREGYFEQNTFTNIHQDVNVYHIPHMKYTVRFGNNAIDLQIKGDM